VTASGRIRRHLWGKPLAELSSLAKRLEPAAVETGIPVDLESALQDYFNGVPKFKMGQNGNLFRDSGGEGGWTGPPGLMAKLLALEGVKGGRSEE